MRNLIGSLVLLSLCIVSGSAAADDFEATGAIHVKTNVQYASVLKDGAPWDDTEYRNGGKTLVIAEIPLDKMPVTFTVVARDKPEFSEIEISATRKNFRKKRQGRTYSWVYQTKVRFSKAKKGATPAKKKGKKAPKKPTTPKRDEADDL